MEVFFLQSHFSCIVIGMRTDDGSACKVKEYSSDMKWKSLQIISDHLITASRFVAILVSPGKGGNLSEIMICETSIWETAEWSLSKYATTRELGDKNLVLRTDHKSSYQQIWSIPRGTYIEVVACEEIVEYTKFTQVNHFYRTIMTAYTEDNYFDYSIHWCNYYSLLEDLSYKLSRILIHIYVFAYTWSLYSNTLIPTYLFHICT